MVEGREKIKSFEINEARRESKRLKKLLTKSTTAVADMEAKLDVENQNVHDAYKSLDTLIRTL